MGFEGSCADGSRDIFAIRTTRDTVRVVAEIRSRHGVPPPARLHSPELQKEVLGRNGRMELATNGDPLVVYLEVPCLPGTNRSEEYTGWVTATLEN